MYKYYASLDEVFHGELKVENGLFICFPDYLSENALGAINDLDFRWNNNIPSDYKDNSFVAELVVTDTKPSIRNAFYYKINRIGKIKWPDSSIDWNYEINEAQRISQKI